MQGARTRSHTQKYHAFIVRDREDDEPPHRGKKSILGAGKNAPSVVNIHGDIDTTYHDVPDSAREVVDAQNQRLALLAQHAAARGDDASVAPPRWSSQPLHGPVKLNAEHEAFDSEVDDGFATDAAAFAARQQQVSATPYAERTLQIKYETLVTQLQAHEDRIHNLEGRMDLTRRQRTQFVTGKLLKRQQVDPYRQLKRQNIKVQPKTFDCDQNPLLPLKLRVAKNLPKEKHRSWAVAPAGPPTRVSDSASVVSSSVALAGGKRIFAQQRQSAAAPFVTNGAAGVEDIPQRKLPRANGVQAARVLQRFVAAETSRIAKEVVLGLDARKAETIAVRIAREGEKKAKKAASLLHEPLSVTHAAKDKNKPKSDADAATKISEGGEVSKAPVDAQPATTEDKMTTSTTRKKTRFAEET